MQCPTRDIHTAVRMMSPRSFVGPRVEQDLKALANDAPLIVGERRTALAVTLATYGCGADGASYIKEY
jgi:hypothetical protein